MKCVYVWINDTTNQPFYVGCGSHTRARTTKKGSRTRSFFDIYNNNECHYEIIFDNLTSEQAAYMERLTIQWYRLIGTNLINKTNGGEMRQDSIWTKEMRDEYSKRLAGENNPNYRHRWTDDMREHLSKIRIEKGIAKGAKNPRATPVMCVETGEIFPCKQDAKEFLGVADACASIWICLKNPKRVAGKGRYHFVSEEMFDKLDTEEKRKEWLEKIAS